jgi:hypothetical protein
MPSSLYFIKFLQDIQAKRDENSREVEETSYWYVVDRIYVQTDRHGIYSLSEDGYKNEP